MAAGCHVPSVDGPTVFVGPLSIVHTLSLNFVHEKKGEVGGGRRESGRMTMMACSNLNTSHSVVVQVLTPLTPHIRQLDIFFSKSL